MDNIEVKMETWYGKKLVLAIEESKIKKLLLQW